MENITNDTFEIDPRYISANTTSYKDMTVNSSKYQEEVYCRAKEILSIEKYTSVLDIGCGSGEKLIRYFKSSRIIGIDLPETIVKLKSQYPEYEWLSTDTEEKIDVDLIVAADVIEHIKNPDDTLKWIRSLQPKKLIISTPERDGMIKEYKSMKPLGPPNSKHHYREWNYDEFKSFMSRYFSIVEHKRFYNIDHTSQYVVCSCVENKL